jgi:AAA ATPase-like protein
MGLRDRCPPDDAVLAPYLPALATLVPHWAAGPAFPAAPPPPDVLAEAMLRVLRWLSSGRGAVLVLEDMHWADRETLAVLEYLADHVTAFPVAVVLTARSDEPGTSGLASALARDPRTCIWRRWPTARSPQWPPRVLAWSPPRRRSWLV